ncbi:hypothetical protein O181_058038 [Austropuccinia psidii MF-1]|uniref:Uncharacterized protein n=1 Tax=Austropuccinia psidii MF-1 TaxID=1389203 RepID=A0A9Q3EG38_9BASI|nr:hypothetical protein [Austropuccinia psidii MF-1]
MLTVKPDHYDIPEHGQLSTQITSKAYQCICNLSSTSSSSFSSTVFSGSTRRTHFKHQPFATCHNIIQPVEMSAQDNKLFELSTHDSLVKKTSLIVNLHTKPTFPEAPSTQEPIKSPPSNEGKSRRKPHPHDLVRNVLILAYEESPTSDTIYSSMEAQLGTFLQHLEPIASVNTSDDSAPLFLRSEETELFKTYSGPVSQGKDSQENLQEVVNTSSEFLEVSTQISYECDSHLDSASLHAITNTSVLPESDDNHSTFASIATPCIIDNFPAKQEPVQIPSKSRSMHVEEPNSYLEHKLKHTYS